MNTEQRYQRLLAWYPRDHRECNGEEMLGVLLAGADDRRPGWRETADLVWGAVRLHLRRVFAVDGGIRPRDVLAIVSLLAPVMVLAGATYGLYHIGVRTRGAWAANSWSYVFPDSWVWGVWAVVAVLGFVGMRRSAAAGAWFGTAGFGLAMIGSHDDVWNPYVWIGPDGGWVLLGALSAIALTWSPGPVRGRELVGTRGFAVLAGVVLATLATGFVAGWTGLVSYHDPVVQVIVQSAFVVGAVVAAGPRSRVGRRAAVLVLLPVIALLPVALFIVGLLPTMVLVYPVFSVALASTVLLFYGMPIMVALLALGGLPMVRRRLGKPVGD